MTRDEAFKVVARAIGTAERCDSFYGDDEPCDGMEGCQACRRMSADAALDALAAKGVTFDG
jgi:hypothetical protein